MKRSSETRLYLSLGSRLTTLLLSLLNFFFYTLPCFDVHVFERDEGQIVKEFTGYELLSGGIPFFSPYAVFLAYAALILSGIILLAFLLQIFTFTDAHVPNIILLGALIIVLEFLLGAESFTGIVMFVLAVIDFIQYFLCLNRHVEIDYWVGGGMLLLILCLIPSALASSYLFA